MGQHASSKFFTQTGFKLSSFILQCAITKVQESREALELNGKHKHLIVIIFGEDIKIVDKIIEVLLGQSKGLFCKLNAKEAKPTLYTKRALKMIRNLHTGVRLES